MSTDLRAAAAQYPAGPATTPVDVRLASGAAVAWLAVALCLGHSSRLALTVAALAAVVGLALLLVAARAVPAAAPLALGAFCVVLVCAPLAGRLAHARDSPLTRLATHRSAVTAVLTMTADPRLLAAKGVAGSPRVAVETAARSIVVDGRAVRVVGAVLVLAPAAPWSRLGPGQRVRVDGTLQPSLDRAALSVTLITRADPVPIGVPPWWQRAAGRVRASLQQAAAGLPTQERGLLPGLIDGDTAGLDPVLAEHFRVAGLTHLVAVSGLNVE